MQGPSGDRKPSLPDGFPPKSGIPIVFVEKSHSTTCSGDIAAMSVDVLDSRRYPYCLREKIVVRDAEQRVIRMLSYGGMDCE